jgi:hypothetical protein
MEKCKDCAVKDCPLSHIVSIRVPDELPEKFKDIIKIFSDLDTMVKYGLDMEPSEQDQNAMIDLLEEHIRKDVGTKIFSKKMRARLAVKRFHHTYKKSHIFFNFVMEKKRRAILYNFLKTITLPSDKGQLHFINGSNFTICAVSHFFDRFIERSELDLRRPESMDLLYRRLMHNPIQVTKGPTEDFFRLNEGIAIGKSFGDEHRIFIFMTYITEDQLTDKQFYFMKEFETFQPKLRNIRV